MPFPSAATASDSTGVPGLKALLRRARDLQGPSTARRGIADPNPLQAVSTDRTASRPAHARVVASTRTWDSNAPKPEDTIALTKILDEHCAKIGRDPAAIRRSSQVRAEKEDDALRIAETALRAGFTELLVFPFAGGDLRSGVERAAKLLPRLRALAA